MIKSDGGAVYFNGGLEELERDFQQIVCTFDKELSRAIEKAIEIDSTLAEVEFSSKDIITMLFEEALYKGPPGLSRIIDITEAERTIKKLKKRGDDNG